MNYASKDITKLQYGKYLSSALAYLMLMQRDAVGMALFDSKIRKFMPPRSATSYLQPVLQELDRVESGDDTRISDVLHVMAERIKRRGLIVLISDLLDDPEEVISGLRHFRHNRHEVLVFHILDRQEIDFDFKGDVLFEDLESKEKIRTFPWYIKNEYRQKVQEFLDHYKHICQENKIDYQMLQTDLTLDKALMEYLIKRNKLY